MEDCSEYTNFVVPSYEKYPDWSKAEVSTGVIISYKLSDVLDHVGSL